jgi:hypothetical protein
MDDKRMLKNRLIGLLVAGSMLAAGAAVAAGKPAVHPGSWIVELTDPPSVEFRGGEPASALALDGPRVGFLEPTAPAVTGADRLDVDAPAVRRYAAYLDDTRARVLQRIRSTLGRDVDPKFVYRHLHNGFAAEMSAEEAERIADLPGVRAVHPDLVQRVHTDVGPEWIGAPDLWTGASGAPNPSRGEGTVLGVIDTGVNWVSIFFDTVASGEPVSNPRGQFYGLCDDGTLDVCNDKLIGIYDFTNEGSRGFDPDGHGSHVASTAVGLPLNLTLDFGSGIQFGTSGVAPRASFISYKACQEPEDGGGGFVCPDSATSAALEQALVDGVDAVNYSIGGPPFDPWSQFGNQRRFLNLRSAGIVPVVSAGNDGPDEFTVGSPANTPWVISVANAHHGRILANRLVGTSGGLDVIGNLVGVGFTQGTPVLDIVYAGDFGNALCGAGEAELGPSCADNTGATSPFAPGTFDGQIVVCDRGIYGRVEKGKNVAEAGAAGMILANTASSPQSVVADEHCLPATHVDREAGDRLRDWLASGSNHRGRLTGTERFIDEQLSGELRDSSSRGPAEGAAGVMKPNVTGPGTDVLAASTAINGAGNGPGPDAANQVGFLTGTSMSSPHVAGAALLLRAAEPTWGIDVIASALETTATTDTLTNTDGAAARVIDRGAGRVQVDQAARIGLYLPVTEQDFLDANPFAEGDPGSLNLPGMLSENCVGTCVFTRTVRALGNGSWTVRGEGELDVRVTPSSFTLSEGQSRTLQIEVQRGRARVGEWAAGSVVLEPGSGSYSTQRLPVGARISAAALPASQDFESDANRGRGEIAIPEVIALDELVFRSSALVRPQQREVTLSQDSSREDPFDGPSGVATEFVEVPPGALLLHAETFASPASDVDLYVGRDDNGDGQAQGAELVCSSTLPDDVEVCDIESPRSGTWWVLVQNWESSGFGGNDIPFEFAVLEDADDPSLVVVGPGAHGGGPLTVPVYWDQPAMEQGDRWFGAVALATEPAETADIGIVPVTVTRTGDNAPAEVALFDGETYATVQPGSTTQDRMFIDVPPSAESVAVTVQGLVTDVTLRRRPFSALAASGTGTPPAPDAVLVQATQDGNTWTAQVGSAGQPPQPGRYYVVVENGNPAEVGVDVTAEVSTSAQLVTPPPLEENFPRRGLWGPEGRAINQGLDFQLGSGGRFAVWYTYDELGRPTFYITDTVAFDPTDPFFRAVLFRPTSNDVRSNLEVVGEVQVTTIAEDRFMFAWRLNGHHGAELFEPVNGTTCPTLDATETPLLGHWFSPTTAAGGVTLLITGSSEAWIRYYYDDLNRPRWVLADTELESSTLPGGSLMEVLGFRGFCIYCEETEVTRAVIGTLERQFIDADTVREVSDFVARPGVDASVDIDRQLQRLSDPVSCSN